MTTINTNTITSASTRASTRASTSTMVVHQKDAIRLLMFILSSISLFSGRSQTSRRAGARLVILSTSLRVGRKVARVRIRGAQKTQQTMPATMVLVVLGLDHF